MEGWWFGDASYLHLSGAVGLLILWQCWSWRRSVEKERDVLKATGRRQDLEQQLQAKLHGLEQELLQSHKFLTDAEAKIELQQKEIQRLRQREEDLQNCSTSIHFEAIEKAQEVMCQNLELQARLQALESELRSTRPNGHLKPDVALHCEMELGEAYDAREEEPCQEASQHMSKVDIDEESEDSEGCSRASSIYSAYPRGRALRRSHSPEMPMVYWWRPRTSTPRPGGTRASQRCFSS